MTTTLPANPLLTVPEVAEELGRPQQQVRALIREGLLPAIKLLPRRTRIPRAALDAWLRMQADAALAEWRQQ